MSCTNYSGCTLHITSVESYQKSVEFGLQINDGIHDTIPLGRDHVQVVLEKLRVNLDDIHFRLKGVNTTVHMEEGCTTWDQQREEEDWDKLHGAEVDV